MWIIQSYDFLAKFREISLTYLAHFDFQKKEGKETIKIREIGCSKKRERNHSIELTKNS